jgi:hypothetical protein
MKLVREHINEKFTEDSDPIADMGIGSKYLIHKWFESIGMDRSKYTIDDNLNIEVKGDLDLYETDITKLPDNLRIEGYLDLRRTPITKLPDNLSVGGVLDLYDTQIIKLPENLSVEGDLDIRGTQITELPKSLKVKRDIYKDFKDEIS